MKYPVLIVGAGYVGQGMAKLFKTVAFWDPPQGLANTQWQNAGVELAVICVPTPMNKIDGSCDTTIVEQAVAEVAPYTDLILIKSTVSPGTTHRLAQKYGKPLVFSPEYMGEGEYWQPPEFPDPRDPRGHRFVVLGGSDDSCNAIIDILMPIMGPNTKYRVMRSREAELVKYFENGFLGLKVTYANLMREICDAAEVNYHAVREGWLDDPRVGRSHSTAFAKKPGYDGKCLPKDIAALDHYAKSLGVGSTLLSGMMLANKK